MFYRIYVMHKAILTAVGFTLLCAPGAQGQSLADVARQEAERRKTIARPGKVYTNESLRTEPQPSTPPAATPAPPAPAAETPAAPAAGTPAPAAEGAAPGSAATPPT